MENRREILLEGVDMADIENLKFEEIGELLRKENLKHAVDKVLEAQGVLARLRMERKQGEEWEEAKAKVNFNYYLGVIGTYLREREQELVKE